MSVNPILATVVMVFQMYSGKPIGGATGFFYGRADQLYLITNRHVVLNEEKNQRPDHLRLRLRAFGQSSLGEGINYDIPLYRKNVPLWFVHPSYPNPPIDVAVIPLDRKVLLKRYFIVALSSGNFLPTNIVLTPGEDVMAIGFPRGLSDDRHNLPILRAALVSTAFGVPFQNLPLFLIDSNLHPGMSGSPILTRPKNMWETTDGATAITTGNPMYLLGIHSATLGKMLPEGTDPLGLGTVWYAQLLEQIIDAIPKK